MAITASALEPIYYPRVTGRLRLSGRSEIEDFDAWHDGLSVTDMLEWLAIKADWLKESASTLLYKADRIDPLRDWSEIVGRADPEKWAVLRGAGRSAMDLRITAELFLGYHDDLVEAGKATMLEQPHPRTRSPRTSRPTVPLRVPENAAKTPPRDWAGPSHRPRTTAPAAQTPNPRRTPELTQ
jgi:hypothetical protein